MLERHILTLRTDDAGPESVAATRERLKGNFPPGAVRRMTQLGMLMSNVLADTNPTTDDAIIYATQYAESHTLETYLESFPAASPIGFQTSIHPGAVQQTLIRRAQPTGDFFPMSGNEYLVGQAIVAALIAPAPRAILCGGEEIGSWLAPIDGASTHAYAYALTLIRPAAAHANTAPAPLGRITLEPSTDAPAPFSSIAWIELLHARKNFSGVIAPGWRTTLAWQ